MRCRSRRGKEHRIAPGRVAAGVSSIGGVANAMVSEVPPVEGLLKFFMHTGTALGAPIVAVLFIAINTILFLLLRRSPKGLDV
jgi:hypothetical protein